MNIKNKKIAIVADWIKDLWGAELVLENLIHIFPNADIFTSVFFQEKTNFFKNKKIKTSFIQKIPFLAKSHKLALIFRPIAFESFDFRPYDIVISSSSAESKWIITKPETLFICYCHTPTRYFWSHYHEYLGMMEFWSILNFIWKRLAPFIINKLRKWDFVAGQRPDFFIANSKNTQKRIKRYYWRESFVIYPPLKLKEFKLKQTKKDFYLYVWRCIPYKKFDLLVDAFNQNGKKLVLVTNTDNKLYRDLKIKSNSNISWKFNISRKEICKLYWEAKAFLFPPEEDFWIVVLEAMACGTPVIAYKKWGALETVVQNKTWVFFDEQNINSLNSIINKFEKMNFDAKEIRKYSLWFSDSIFEKNILNFVETKYNKW